MGGARCELCGRAAAVHCAADSAFLCLRCDARVHGANFLASRHLRSRLPGAASALRSASSAAASSGSATTSSCVSTADSAESSSSAAAPAPPTGSRGRKQPHLLRPRRARAEAVLEGWAKRAGLGRGPARRRAASAAASTLRALGRGVAAARVPLRVAMAAALWSEIGAAGSEDGPGAAALLLRRLEATAHVPARLVLAVAAWMARAGRPAGHTGHAEQEQEGWAECS